MSCQVNYSIHVEDWFCSHTPFSKGNVSSPQLGSSESSSSSSSKKGKVMRRRQLRRGSGSIPHRRCVMEGDTCGKDQEVFHIVVVIVVVIFIVTDDISTLFPPAPTGEILLRKRECIVKSSTKKKQGSWSRSISGRVSGFQNEIRFSRSGVWWGKEESEGCRDIVPRPNLWYRCADRWWWRDVTWQHLLHLLPVLLSCYHDSRWIFHNY